MLYIISKLASSLVLVMNFVSFLFWSAVTNSSQVGHSEIRKLFNGDQPDMIAVRQTLLISFV